MSTVAHTAAALAHVAAARDSLVRGMSDEQLAPVVEHLRSAEESLQAHTRTADDADRQVEAQAAEVADMKDTHAQLRAAHDAAVRAAQDAQGALEVETGRTAALAAEVDRLTARVAELEAAGAVTTAQQ